MKNLLVTAAACLCFAVNGLAAEKVSDVTRDKLGQEISLQGTVSSFRASKGEKSPNSFTLKDASGETRVVIWPDAFSKVDGKDALQKDGATVSVSGEVAEYREKVEVHVKDASKVKVAGGSAAAATSGTLSAASATSSTH
jgi:exonuclease VII large subunit